MIGASRAFIIYVGAMVVTFGLTAFKPSAPYLAFATQLTIGFSAYIAKRLIQKGEKYQPKGANNGNQNGGVVK